MTRPIQYEVINYRQAADSTQRNVQAMVNLMRGRRQFVVTPFTVTCLDCGHEWKALSREWGFAKVCPECGSGDTR